MSFIELNLSHLKQKYQEKFHSKEGLRSTDLEWISSNVGKVRWRELCNSELSDTCFWYYSHLRSLLVSTSRIVVLHIHLQHSATRKHIFLYFQGDRSGITKSKRITISIINSFLQCLICFYSDSVLTNPLGKDGLQGC